MNARHFAQKEGETPDSLKAQVEKKLLADQLGTIITCASAKRQQRGKDTAQGIVVVQFKEK